MFRNEAQGPEDSRRLGGKILRILRREALAVTEIEQAIVRRGAAGELVDVCVGDDDPEIIRAGVEERRDVEDVRRMPDRAREFAVDID